MNSKKFRTRTDRTLCVLYVGTNLAANTTDSSHAKVRLAGENLFTVIYSIQMLSALFNENMNAKKFSFKPSGSCSIVFGRGYWGA